MKLIIEPSEKKLSKVLSSLDPDATILHHTGKMFGIGCRISSETAIKRIVEQKQRSDKAGMIILIPSIDWLKEYQINIPTRLEDLIKVYWPGNLSLIWKVDHYLSQSLGYNGKLAFRLPADPLLQGLIAELGEPIVSTSINISNLPAETDLDKILDRYSHWFDIGILPNPKRLPETAEASTILEYLAKDEVANDSNQEQIKCLREGSIPFYEIKAAFNRPTIMFVCTANICRSPIAEKLFTYYAREKGLHYVGDSCGLIQGGHEISLNSMTLLMEKGIEEAQQHISKQINPEMVSGSRIVLTMEERQRDHIRKADPQRAHKVFTLNEYVGETGDIEDPYGSELENYRKTYCIIEDRILRLIDKLQKEKGL